MFTRKLIALLLSVVLLLSMVGCGASPSDDSDAVQRQAVISRLSGEARILRGDGSSEKAAQGSVLLSGDSVLTESGAVASLSLDDDKTLTISPSSEILFSTLTEDGGTKTVILVKRGSLASSVDQKLEAGDIYEVCTGDMTMAIRGTDACLEATPNGTVVTLLTGYALSLNYSTGKVYVVPAGVSALFPPNAEPSFELIDTEAFADSSEAAAAMLQKVRKENRNYKNDFETELRESYIDDYDYSFSITTPMACAVPSAEITTTQAVTTTATTTTTSAAPETKPAAPTAKPSAKPTAPITTKATTSATHPTVPTPPTTASTAASTSVTQPTVPTPPTTASTAASTSATQPTVPTPPTTASTAASTSATQPTVPTPPTPPTEPTAAGSSAVSTTAAENITAPISSEATEKTTASSEPTAERYNVVLTGLYYQEQGSSEWIPLTTGQIWSGLMEVGSFTTVNYTLNGESFSFWVQCSEQMCTPYDYPYFSDSFPSNYQSVKTFASASLAS